MAATAGVVALVSSPARAVTVNGTDDIYMPAGAGDGTAPPSVQVSGGDMLTFTASGSIILNVGTGDNSNGPDGDGASPADSSNTGIGSFSGIKAPNAGYLVGVFVAAGGPSGPAPASLDYTTTSSTSSLSYSPLLDQIFFIGDGLTGNGTGTSQTFVAPSGAVSLYLGISDASSYNGAPGAYDDNSGNFSVTVSGNSTTPLPSALPLFVSGIGALGALIRRRKKQAA